MVHAVFKKWRNFWMLTHPFGFFDPKRKHRTIYTLKMNSRRGGGMVCGGKFLRD